MHVYILYVYVKINLQEYFELPKLKSRNTNFLNQQQLVFTDALRRIFLLLAGTQRVKSKQQIDNSDNKKSVYNMYYYSTIL